MISISIGNLALARFKNYLNIILSALLLIIYHLSRLNNQTIISDCIFDVTKCYFFQAFFNTATEKLSNLRPYRGTIALS